MFGLRIRERPQPRFGSGLAVTGAVLTVAGLLIWMGTYYAQGLHRTRDYGLQRFGPLPANGGGNIFRGLSETFNSDRRFLAFALFLVLVLVGTGLALWRRRGPLASGGAVAAALSVPLAMIFVTLTGVGLTVGLRAQVDSVFLVSIVAWLIGYVLVPGLQGRAFLLGIALTAIVSYIAIKAGGAAGSTVTQVVIQGGDARPVGGSDGLGATHLNTLGALGLAFGLGYYAVAALLDLAGLTGTAVAFVYAGFTTLVVGIASYASDFGETGTGITLLLVGALLAAYGARFGRRFTSWVWLAGAVLGVVLLVARVAKNSGVGVGVTFLVIGVVVAVAAQLGSSVLHERPEYPDALR